VLASYVFPTKYKQACGMRSWEIEEGFVSRRCVSLLAIISVITSSSSRIHNRLAEPNWRLEGGPESKLIASYDRARMRADNGYAYTCTTQRKTAWDLEFHFRHILESPPAFTHMLIPLYPALFLVWTQLYRRSQDLVTSVDRCNKMYRYVSKLAPVSLRFEKIR